MNTIISMPFEPVYDLIYTTDYNSAILSTNNISDIENNRALFNYSSISSLINRLRLFYVNNIPSSEIGSITKLPNDTVFRSATDNIYSIKDEKSIDISLNTSNKILTIRISQYGHEKYSTLEYM